MGSPKVSSFAKDMHVSEAYGGVQCSNCQFRFASVFYVLVLVFFCLDLYFVQSVVLRRGV